MEHDEEMPWAMMQIKGRVHFSQCISLAYYYLFNFLFLSCKYNYDNYVIFNYFKYVFFILHICMLQCTMPFFCQHHSVSIREERELWIMHATCWKTKENESKIPFYINRLIYVGSNFGNFFCSLMQHFMKLQHKIATCRWKVRK